MSTTQEKEVPQGNILKFFQLDTPKTTILMESLTLEGLSKIRALFSILEKDRGGLSSPPTCMPVSVAEYLSISLNIPKCPWKYLNQLFWLCQGSEYAWSSYMFNRHLKIPWVLNKPGLWIWHSCMWKGYSEFQISLAPQAWIWLNFAVSPSICQKIPE